VRFPPATRLVVLVAGAEAQAEAVAEEVAAVLGPMGLRLSAAKTRVVHIDEGLDFLGFRIRRHRKRGTERRYVYTYPAKAALAAVKRKVKAISRQGTNKPLSDLLRQLNLVLRGWTTYFRYGVSAATFGYLRHYSWRRVVDWLRHKHRRAGLEAAATALPHWRGVMAGAGRSDAVQPGCGEDHSLPLPARPDPFAVGPADLDRHVVPRGSWRAGCVATRTSGSGGGPGKRTRREAGTAPRADLTWR